MDSLDDWKKYETTLKETSKSEPVSGEVSYMTELTIPAYNFDRVVHEYAKPYHLEKIPASNDALVQQGDHYYFIEFKSGNLAGGQKIAEVKRKIYDSLLIFNDIIGETISFTRAHMSYVLVYDPIKNQKPLADIIKVMGALAKRPADLFGLRGQFRGVYFNEVYTLSTDELEEKIISSFTTMKEHF